ncbi:MAG: NYN domain-containing protein [Dehalococcoidia bacterium]
MPRPSSLAGAPAADADAAPAEKKRRRGTRGGRGRKKPGAAAQSGSAEIIELPKPAARPASTNGAVAEPGEALGQFAREVTEALGALQSSIADLQARIGDTSPSTSHPRVGMFVDVPNVIYAAERRGITIDFGRVLEYFARGRELVRASAYAPISDDPQAKLENQRFVQHFIGHPYRIITKPLKRFADGSMKANFDIELAIDILTMSDRLDVVVLMSGDGDFRRLVELVASRGVRVEVVAFGESVSQELRAVADLYVDLGAHLDEFKPRK